MSLTAIAWLLLFGGLLLAGFVNPLWALIAYMLEYYQRPDLNWWGRDLPDLRWSLTASVLLFGAFLVRYQGLPRAPGRRSWAMALLVAGVINTFLVTIWAVRPSQSYEWATTYAKVTAVAVVMHQVVRTPVALNAVIGANIAGVTKWGVDGRHRRRTRARLEGVGSADTRDSNALAAHLLTVIPFLALWGLSPPNRWFRIFAILCAPFVLNLFVLANSRGAMVGLVAAAAYVFFFAAKGRRVALALTTGTLLVGLYVLADPQFVSRQQTTTAVQDGSAQARLTTWRGSADMIQDYPFGAGGRGFHTLSPIYVPEITDRYDGQGRSAHNTYIQMTAEWGLQGGVLFLGFVAASIRSLWRVRRDAAADTYLRLAATALEAGLVGFLTAAAFTDSFYNEGLYWMFALAMSLDRMAPRPAEAEVAEEQAVA